MNFLKENIGNYTNLFDQISKLYELTIFVFNFVKNKDSFYKEEIYLFFGIDIIFEITSTLHKIELYFQDSDIDEVTIKELEGLK